MICRLCLLAKDIKDFPLAIVPLSLIISTIIAISFNFANFINSIDDLVCPFLSSKSFFLGFSGNKWPGFEDR